jgi:hypothetical protein
MAINDGILDRIVRVACNTRFAVENNNLRMERAALGRAIYERVVPADVQQALLTLDAFMPGVFVCKTSYIKVIDDSGDQNSLPLEGVTAFRPATDHLWSITAEEMAAWNDLIAREDALDDRQRELMDKLHAFLASFDSLDELRAAWPEGKPFIDQAVFETNGKPTPYPKQQINAMLGIG